MKHVIYITIIFIMCFLSSCEIDLIRDNPLDNHSKKDTLGNNKKIGVIFSKYEIVSDNNSDGIVNKGESIGLKVYLKNTTSSKVNKVKASIACSSPYISALSPTTSVGYREYTDYISPGEESTYGNYPNNTVSFTVSDSTPNGTIIKFNISIIDELNQTWIDSFKITVNAIAGIIKYSRFVVSSDNNSDGIVNKGESIGLKVYLKNTGSSKVNKVKASILCSSSYLSALSPTTSVSYKEYTDYISSGEESTCGNYPNNTVSFNVSNTTPIGTVLTFNLSITDESNNIWSDSFTITVSGTGGNIQYSRLVVSSDNNNDGIVNKGESIGLKVYLKNTGSSKVNNVKASISCSSPYISALSPTTSVSYKEYTDYISSGEESSYGNYPNNNTISFNVSNTTPIGTVLTFNLSITDESSNTWSDSFTITVSSTGGNIQYSRLVVSTDNNNDGIVNKGESIGLKVYLKNTGSSKVNNVKASISCSSPYISALSPTTSVSYKEYTDYISSGEESSYGNYPNNNTISFNVSNTTPIGTVLIFNLSITDESNNTWSDSFNITVN